MIRILKAKFVLPLIVLIIACAVTAMLFVTKPAIEEEETDVPELTVDVYTAIYDKHVWSSRFQGSVRAKTDIELVSQVTGKVVEVSDQFIEGGQFKAGEMLIKIDDADYQVALKSAEAAVASAEVDLDIELASASTNAREWQELQGRPIEEANPLRLNKPQTMRAKARLDAAMAELDAAKLNLSRTIITAPFDGRIMTKSAELGQFLSRGTSVGRVFSTDMMEIRIPMTDIQIGELGLNLGYQSDADSKLTANVSANFGIEFQQWTGYLKSVDASIDSDTRLLYSTIVVEEPFVRNEQHSSPLVPGLFVDVELLSTQPLEGIKIPRTALRKGTQIYVADDGKLRIKTVRVMYTSEEFAILSNANSSFVEAGDQVIVSSVPGAYEGMPIKIKDEEAELTYSQSTIESDQS